MRMILFISLCLFLNGCNTSDPEGKGTFSENYVRTYFVADDISSITLHNMSDRSFFLDFSGSAIFQKDTKLFNPLAGKYGDLSYNKRIAYYPGRNEALANELTEISVVSDADYDDSHPAGTSLCDIISFRGRSLYAFVTSGYNSAVEEIFDKMLSELSHNEMKLVTVVAKYESAQVNEYFRFISAPTLSQEHNITLTIRDNDGNVFTITKFFDFDDSSAWEN